LIQDYRLDFTSVQLALNAIGIWLKVWQLQLAAPKCGSLLLNINRNFQDGESLVLNGQQFLKFNTITDLGIIIDDKLSFSLHISGIISKAKKRIYLIFKSFSSRKIALFTFFQSIYIAYSGLLFDDLESI